MGVQIRVLRWVLAALAAVLLLASCGSSSDGTTDTSADADAALDSGDSGEEGQAATSEGEAGESADAAAGADIIEVEATTSTVVKAAPETTTTVAQADFILPEAGPGLGAFALQVFQAGELGLTPAEQGCVDGRLQSELRITRGVPFDTLDIPQQATSIEILLDCAGGRLEGEFLSSFETTDELADLGFGDEFASCIYREISRDDDEQSKVVLALASMTADQAAPEETVDAAATTFARCVDVVTFLIDSFTSDPAAASLMDSDCLRTEIDEAAAADLFAAALRDPNQEDPSSMASGFRAFRPCMRFGLLMAEQFEDSVAFNEAEISCIDTAFGTDEIFDAMISGAELPASATESLVACLEPATLNALNG